MAVGCPVHYKREVAGVAVRNRDVAAAAYSHLQKLHGKQTQGKTMKHYVCKGAYWYDNCADSNLNGYQYAGNNTPRLQGIVWGSWKGVHYSLKATTMMIRSTY
ncbi:Angiopoietin-2 [Portunus trituberculatus]|uniref:Angiopoietin-2 n=1 Tax=Portunus trituberculatus TaxID=210409 RepID=A0A5B7CUA5_PORTR|nr:Angiopoietin-2 [Portunus trituberculatus]